MALILASASPIRRQMLEAAGVEFEVRPSKLDEGALKKLFADNPPADVARALAGGKAFHGSRRPNGAWVIGSDSIVSVDGRMFDKPADRDTAAEHLRAFSGKVMTLTSAVALACSGNIVWHYEDSAQLYVRELSDEFIETYLDAEWPEVAYCVGVFRMEGRGVTLFERVEGSHFTILGMPLIPLLGALRERGLMAA